LAHCNKFRAKRCLYTAAVASPTGSVLTGASGWHSEWFTRDSTDKPGVLMSNCEMLMTTVARCSQARFFLIERAHTELEQEILQKARHVLKRARAATAT
jgi:hypothetical protein